MKRIDVPSPSKTMSSENTLFATPPGDVASYLERLRDVDALGMPLLSEAGRRSLLNAAEALPFRQARPFMGAPGKEVQQDFEICMDFQAGDSFLHLSERLGEHLLAAAELMPAPALSKDLLFNDLAVQRYIPGSAGITPHRDFLQFRQVVVLIILAGQGRFFVCDNREGLNAVEVPVKPGDALLMQAPDFGGQNRRPFHFLRDITERRVIVGLRYDGKKAHAEKESAAYSEMRFN